MEDLNAEIGNEREKNFIGNFGLGNRNERGETYRNSIQSVETYPGTNVRSDHNSLKGQFRIKLKKLLTNINIKKNMSIVTKRRNDKSTCYNET